MRPTRVLASLSASLPASLLAALLLVAASSVACKKSKADPPDQACTVGQLGASCSVGADCCSGNCRDGALGRICVQGGCGAIGVACSANSDCCGGACKDFTCQDIGSCGAPLNAACDENSDCCSNYCVGTIGNQVCKNPETCGNVGDSCAVGADCCLEACGSDGKCATPSGKLCRGATESCTSDDQCCSANCASGMCTSGLFCDTVGVACDSASDCCSVRCVSGACSSGACRQATETCSSGGDCCSGVCNFGKCEALLPGPTNKTCKTYGEACALGSECCSTNCSGGACMPSSPSGGAPGEICYRDDDCASGICAPPARPGEPGRCGDASGGCGLDGYPCTSDSNCCTKKCVDLGTGAKVCQPSGGCRMTGNYCDSTAACCGGTNETDTTQEGIYGVFCDGVGRSPGHAEYDTSTQDSRTCTGGQACNPPGNICGYKASQNCCYDGGGSGKAVCKPDSGGILRCFGGPVTCTPAQKEVDPTCCDEGWDANDPYCCKPEGAVCQFRDQCCGGTPCVPDAAGVLRCANVSTCLPFGTRGCDAAGADPCCAGTTCQNLPEVGFACAPPGCTGASCTDCRTIGNSCSGAVDCCSGVCEGGLCRAPCVPETGTCTRNDDCCTGLTCSIDDGKTSGTCVGSGGGGGGDPICSATGQLCATAGDCCNSSDECTGGVCVTPAPVCVEVEAVCATQGDCCPGLSCVGYDLTEDMRACGTAQAGTPCFCAQVTCSGDAACVEQCSAISAPCSTQVACCTGYCAPNDGSAGGCTTTDTTKCECRPAG